MTKITREALLFSLSKKIDEVISPLIPSGAKCALIDFPNYPNAGDSAIWLGEKKWLEKNKNEIVYICDKETYSQDILAQKIEDGIILLQGGGNFGDLWTDLQNFRERVIRDFPNNKIIQLPQTIFFKKEKGFEKTRKVLNAHPDFTLLCRDNQSLDLAQKEFTIQSKLCPDMAFALGPLERFGTASTEILWLFRTDKETLNKATPEVEQGMIRTDWLDEIPTQINETNQHLTREMKLYPHKKHSVYALLIDTYYPLAQQRFLRGCNVLSQGKVVVTDRLHGHIVSLLLGIPHVLMDNSYGKIKGFYETWTCGNELTIWADAVEEVINSSLPDEQFQQVLKNRGIEINDIIERLKKSMSTKTGWTTPEEDIQKQWMRQVDQTKQEILKLVQSGQKLIMVDEDLIRKELDIENTLLIPFMEHQQHYWGLPADDESAINEIERLRELKVNYIVFTWPAFWWLDHYAGMNNYLNSNFKCIRRNENVIAYHFHSNA